MPIRPENKARYPTNWKTEVVPRIRARSGNRCECTGQCGIPHIGEDNLAGRCPRWHLEFIVEREATVILTVAHLNHRPEDCSDENLLHMCQGCHNRYDLPTRRANRRARLRVEQEVTQGVLFCDPVG